MSLWRQLKQGLRNLTHRDEVDQDLEDEVRDYFNQATASLEERGLSTADARRVAQLQFGNSTSIREQARSYGWERMFEPFAADLHFGARQLRHNPGFSLVAILTLALGIGASTAIFSAVNPILFQPLPYPHAGSLMMLHEVRGNGPRLLPSFGTFHG